MKKYRTDYPRLISMKVQGSDNSQPQMEDLEQYKQITQRIDYPNFVTNKSSVNVCKLTEVDWYHLRPGRAGVIVYTDVESAHTKKKSRYYFLGVDTQSRELTDFGGGVQYKIKETPIEAALREFAEESLCCFGKIDDQNLLNSTVVYGENMMIIFIPMQIDIRRVISDFDKMVRYAYRPEVRSIVAVSHATLDKFINGDCINKGENSYRLYSRVRKLLSCSGVMNYIDCRSQTA